MAKIQIALKSVTATTTNQSSTKLRMEVLLSTLTETKTVSNLPLLKWPHLPDNPGQGMKIKLRTTVEKKREYMTIKEDCVRNHSRIEIKRKAIIAQIVNSTANKKVQATSVIDDVINTTINVEKLYDGYEILLNESIAKVEQIYKDLVEQSTTAFNITTQSSTSSSSSIPVTTTLIPITTSTVPLSSTTSILVSSTTVPTTTTAFITIAPPSFCIRSTSLKSSKGIFLKSACMMGLNLGYYNSSMNCTNNGMQLIMFRNLEELVALYNWMTLVSPAGRAYWINGYYADGAWFVTNPTQTPLFTEAVPQNVSGNCLEFTNVFGNFTTNGVMCTKNMYQICEFNVSPLI